MNRPLVFLLGLGLSLCLAAAAKAGSYAPAAGKPGSTAISAQDPDIAAWATGWTDYQVGTGVENRWQDPTKALGPPAGTVFDVVSLGEGGRITLTFNRPIQNRAGWDFAVFENAFNDTSLELAYVEVSSDGVNFIRFENHSLTPAPVDGFGAVDPTNVTGLAGKYRLGFGTPFDLQDLASRPEVLSGLVNLAAITHVRLIDVVGDGTCLDSDSRPIYDPYPTALSAGFDLDAVAVLSQAGGENSPPQAPTPLTPAGGAIGQPLVLTLSASAFIDPDQAGGDFHFQSRWQVGLDPGLATLILDLTTPLCLNSLPLGAELLRPETLYYWRVRYVDSAGAASDWSATSSFTTTVINPDANGNGLPDGQEFQDPDVDLNRDSVADMSQISSTYKALAAAGGGYLALETASVGTTIAYFAALDPGDPAVLGGPDRPDAFWLGLVRFRLLVASPGDAAKVTLWLSSPAPAGYAWYRFDPVLGWHETDGSAVLSLDRSSVTLTLTDGGAGDADGLANGVIVDPGGLGIFFEEEPVQPPRSGEAGVGSGGGCFLGALPMRSGAGWVLFDLAGLFLLALAVSRKPEHRP
jgi:hypothetical protein